MITEEEIEGKLKELSGKIPNVLIEDLRKKLIAKKDILTPEQVERIVNKVRETYSGQVERLDKLNKRVDEIGRHIDEIRNLLLKETGTIPESVTAKETQEPGVGSFALTHGVKKGVGEAGVDVEKGGSPSDYADLLFGGGKNMGREKVGGIFFEPREGKSRLEKIPDDVLSTMLAFKWLGFLIDKVGRQNLEKILEFYYGIGWISEDVLNTMMKYAEGVKPHVREPDWKPEEKLTIRDHLVSLMFIERLRGTKITRDILDRVDRETRMIERMLEEVYGV